MINLKTLTTVWTIIGLMNAHAAETSKPQPDAKLSIGDLQVEHRVSPVGIDARNPRFSWQLHGAGNGLRQTAYQIQIASSAASLEGAGKAYAWDSGWVVSDQSYLVAYAGSPLQSSMPYFWRVRVKDGNGAISPWSTPARWVTGLMDAEKELQADWIGLDQQFKGTPQGIDWFDIGNAKWICHPGTEAGKAGAAFYRKTVMLPKDTARVMMGMEANFAAQLFVNGVEVFQGGRFDSVPSYLDITPWIHPGQNQIAFRVYQCDPATHVGLISSLRIEMASGAVEKLFTDETWESTDKPVDLWSSNAQSGEGWGPVKVLGKPGEPNTTGRGKPTLFTPTFGDRVFLPPPVYLRKEILMSKPVRFAVFHGTAQGLYDLYVNGRRLTPSGFQPGWTQFDMHTSYVSTDVTDSLKPGRNAIGAVLADGWFRGNLLWFGREGFGEKLRFSGQLEVEYTDGSRESFRTDPTWKASFGPTLQSDIMQGEIYDARRELPGWDKPGFDDQGWSAVNVLSRSEDYAETVRVDVTTRVRDLLAQGKPVVANNSLADHDPYRNIAATKKGLSVECRIDGADKTFWIGAPRTWTPPTGLKPSDIKRAAYGGETGSIARAIQRAHPTEPVRPQGELAPQAITEPKPGVYVVDFGQNFSGWVRLNVSGRAGQSIYLRFAEDLKSNGTIYTDNLRGINPADRYICKGGGAETWEPRFTCHGFRYVQILGLTQKPTNETVTGIYAHSGGPINSKFASSSPMLDRLYKNVTWSQRSNYFETMTDCPQRDERYGWVGDAHFFMRSSAYNQNGASFFTKWFLDCVDSQGDNGNISNGCPRSAPGKGNSQLDWTAAMMIAPWVIWQHYGDAKPIADNYDALRKYMTLWQKYADDVDAGKGKKEGGLAELIIGDWCALQFGTPTPFIGRFYGYNLSLMMADFARITKHDEDVRTFTDLAARYRGAIISKHIAPDGTVQGNTQTGYALVSRYHLYEPAQEQLIREKFQKRMNADKFGVRTGFLGTGNLLQGLCSVGLVQDAGKTILSEEYPGWGNMVTLGATTIWEHWDGKSADGKWQDPYMNSFNHYTFGGCGEWLMGWLVGLRADSPGFKTVRVEPTIIPSLTWVSGSFESPYGTVSNRWEQKDGRITMRLVIPPNSNARVVLPASAKDATLQGKPFGTAPVNGHPEGMVISGNHLFTWIQ